MKIVVTGHTGFVGRYLAERLNEKGYLVYGLSRSTGKDITDVNVFNDVGQFNLLIHLAANSFVPLSFKEPGRFYYENLTGTLNCLEACRKNKARIIYLSSYIYGQPQFLPITEDHPVQPTNPYMESKFLGEQLCQAYYRDFHVPVGILRPFNLYGKGQRDHFLIPTIVNQISGGEIRLQDPRPRRDFVHVADLVEAIINLLAFQKDYCVYNIASGVSISINDIIQILNRHGFVKRDKVYYTNERRTNEVLETRADVSKAWNEIGWRPVRNFEEELVKFTLDKVGTKETL